VGHDVLVLPIHEKIRIRKSHATVPLRVSRWMFFFLFSLNLVILENDSAQVNMEKSGLVGKIVVLKLKHCHCGCPF